MERGSQSHAVVTGHGLHIDFIEQPRTHQLAIGRAVQRNPSGQSNSPQSRLLCEVAADVEDRFVQALLKSGSHILMDRE